MSKSVLYIGHHDEGQGDWPDASTATPTSGNWMLEPHTMTLDEAGALSDTVNRPIARIPVKLCPTPRRAGV